MGIDTYGEIKGRISPEEIVKVIKQKFGVDAVSEVTTHVYEKLDNLDFTFRNYGGSDNWESDNGFILFELK